MIDPDPKAIARKLGPERCASALAAYVAPCPTSFRACVVARIYGVPGELRTAMKQYEREHGIRDDEMWPALLGLTEDEVDWLTTAYDCEFGVCLWAKNSPEHYARFRAFSVAFREALEEEAAKVAPVYA